MEIYIPPSRAQRASSISLGLASDLPDDVGLLEDAAKEIENAISHLRRSNIEIQDFDPNGEDPELVDAIAGNIVALAKKEERLKKIRDKMAALGARTDPCVSSTTAGNQKPTRHTPPPSPSADGLPVDGVSSAPAPSGPAATATGDAVSGSGGSIHVSGLAARIQTLDISSPPTEECEDEGIDL